MDLSRPYNNPNLEQKRQRRLQDQACVERLRAGKQTRSRCSKTAAWAVAVKKKMHGRVPERLDALLDAVARESDLLDDLARYGPALAALARWYKRWLNEPATWKARSYNSERCFGSLARHLLARYDVPRFLDGLWLDGTTAAYQNWFIDIGQGRNIRHAPNLPVAFTKAQAHAFLEAPPAYSVHEAVRWGQLRGLGAEERMVEAVNGTFLGREFFAADVEAFWATVLGWLVQNQTMDVRQVGPVLDYIKTQKFDDEGYVWVDDRFEQRGPPQPAFGMKGRTVDSLLRQTRQWHERLTKGATRHATAWPPCGIAGLERMEGEHRVFRIDELLSSQALTAEGRAMRHCVGSYAQSCAARRCAIFSMQMLDRGQRLRMLTVEVDLRSRTVVQARKQWNALATDLDLRVLHIWATQERLTLGRWVAR